jgi:uncharacterized protein (TIGR02246 family)
MSDVRHPDLVRLMDEAAIKRLLLSVGAALDKKDWDTYANCYVEDGVFEILGQRRVGRDEIVDGPKRDLERFDRLQHLHFNHFIDVDGDRASVSHYMIAIHVPDAQDPQSHADIGGRYSGSCVRTDDGWKLSQLRLEIFWTAGEAFAIPAGEA